MFVNLKKHETFWPVSGKTVERRVNRLEILRRLLVPTT